MDIETLESTTFEAIVEKIQKVRKRGELLESIQGILKRNFKSIEIEHQIECKKIRNIIEEQTRTSNRPHERDSPYPRQGGHRQGIRCTERPRTFGTPQQSVYRPQLRRIKRRHELFRKRTFRL